MNARLVQQPIACEVPEQIVENTPTTPKVVVVQRFGERKLYRRDYL